MPQLIGLNIDINVNKPSEARIARSYFEALQLQGATTILIPPMTKAKLRPLLRKLSGVAFIGGRDYSAKIYGGDELQPYNPLHADRQEFDLEFAHLALSQNDLPILGICGGMQLINIALGGTLVEDIPSFYGAAAITHQGSAGVKAHHPVNLHQGSKLARIYGTRRLPFVRTSHHQCIKDLGKNLSEVATADDGVPEAIEMPGSRFVIGVQWHPESDLTGNKRLFNAFLKAAGRRTTQ